MDKHMPSGQDQARENKKGALESAPKTNIQADDKGSNALCEALGTVTAEFSARWIAGAYVAQEALKRIDQDPEARYTALSPLQGVELHAALRLITKRLEEVGCSDVS
jgi:hypothetical protein